MDVDVLVDLDDVVGLDLGADPFGDKRKEPLVEIMPGIVLLNEWVHTREG